MLNTRELDILNILWNSGVPMTSSDIVNAGRGLSQSTVQAVLRKLLNANLVKVSGITIEDLKKVIEGKDIIVTDIRNV